VLHDRFGDQSYDAKEEEKEKIKIKKMLEKKSKSDDNRAFKSMRAFYKTCLDHGRLNSLGATPLLEAFEVLGGWPLLSDDWREEQHSWSSLNKKMFELGFVTNYLINVVLEGDPRNSSRYIMKAKASEEHPLNSFKSLLVDGLESKQVKAYYEYMINFSVLLGCERSKAEMELLQVLSFEAELYKVKCGVIDELLKDFLCF
jgi:Peptidase family M13